MQVYQQYQFNFPRARVYQIIKDTKEVEQIIPLVTHIEETNKNKYKVHAALEVGPITGKLSAGLEIEQEYPPVAFITKVQYRHLLGNVFGTFTVNLEAVNVNQTKMVVSGAVSMTRLLKAVAYKIQPTTVDGLMHEFFVKVNNALKKKHYPLTPQHHNATIPQRQVTQFA